MKERKESEKLCSEQEPESICVHIRLMEKREKKEDIRFHLLKFSSHLLPNLFLNVIIGGRGAPSFSTAGNTNC